MEEEKTDTENTGAEESKPEETTEAESKTEEAPAEEAKTEEAPAETATAEAPPEQESPKEDSDDGGGDSKRPTFLTVLCILTFIGSGLGLLGSILMMVGVGALSNMLGGMGGGALDGGTAYFGVSALLAAGSLYGALQMWKQKKMGFYLYTVSNVVLAILPMVWLGAAFGAMGLVVPIIFIVLYGLNLKHMS